MTDTKKQIIVANSVKQSQQDELLIELNPHKQKADQLGVPLIPVKKITLPVVQPIDTNPNPTVAVCGQCGLEIKQIMNMVCQNSNCPLQPVSIS